MDSTIIASLIGGCAILGASYLTHRLTKKTLASRTHSAKVIKEIGNIAHRKRNYNKTKKIVKSLLKECAEKKQIPDLYITNLGTPVEHLKHCEGFYDYQQYLQNISNTGECIIHRYHTVQSRSSKEYLSELKQQLTSNANCNLYANFENIVFPTVVNFLVFSNTFAAVTFETAAKIQVSFHTRDTDEVLGVKEVVLAIQSQFTPVIIQGERINDS